MLDALPDALELILRRLVDGIEHVGPVDRHPRNMIVNVKAHRHQAAPASTKPISASTALVC